MTRLSWLRSHQAEWAWGHLIMANTVWPFCGFATNLKDVTWSFVEILHLVSLLRVFILRSWRFWLMRTSLAPVQMARSYHKLKHRRLFPCKLASGSLVHRQTFILSTFISRIIFCAHIHEQKNFLSSYSRTKQFGMITLMNRGIYRGGISMNKRIFCGDIYEQNNLMCPCSWTEEIAVVTFMNKIIYHVDVHEN
jgi:hypothetical protein